MLTINVDLNKKCVECGKGGAMDNLICLACTRNALTGKMMKSPAGKAVAARFQRDIKKRHPTHR